MQTDGKGASMGIEDIRLKLDTLEHDKIRELQGIFDAQEKSLGSVAILCWVRLIIYAARNKQDGLLDLTERRIASAAGWLPRRPDAFINALVGCELLDKTPDGYQLHDWEEHQPYVAASSRRIATAKKAAFTRWEKHKGNQGDNAGSNAVSKKSNADSQNSNAPTLTIPTLTNQRKKSALSGNSNAVLEKSNATSMTRGVIEPEDFVGSVIVWFNENVVPPFVASNARTKKVDNEVRRCSDVLREINQGQNIGQEFAEMIAYLGRASAQYGQGQIPCKWGLLNLCKEENIIKITDGVFEEESADDWAQQMKEKERAR